MLNTDSTLMDIGYLKTTCEGTPKKKVQMGHVGSIEELQVFSPGNFAWNTGIMEIMSDIIPLLSNFRPAIGQTVPYTLRLRLCRGA